VLCFVYPRQHFVVVRYYWGVCATGAVLADRWWPVRLVRLWVWNGPYACVVSSHVVLLVDSI
jgi:hypothetical protein